MNRVAHLLQMHDRLKSGVVSLHRAITLGMFLRFLCCKIPAPKSGIRVRKQCECPACKCCLGGYGEDIVADDVLHRYDPHLSKRVNACNPDRPTKTRAATSEKPKWAACLGPIFFCAAGGAGTGWGAVGLHLHGDAAPNRAMSMQFVAPSDERRPAVSCSDAFPVPRPALTRTMLNQF